MGVFVGLVLASFSARAEGIRISFNSRDGTRLSGVYYRAVHPRALLLVIHGFQSHAGWYQSGDELAAQGISSLAFDRRGSGLSEGWRGHASSKMDFLEDADAAARVLRARAPQGLPLHLLANCFGTRVAIPLVVRRPGAFASLILTSPGTHMTDRADYGFLEKLDIGLVGSDFEYLASPLHDEDFVSTDPWLSWIHWDPLSLRMATKGFWRSTRRLTHEMFLSIPQMKIPLLVFLADRDAMVRNDDVKREFFAPYAGPKRLVELHSEHYLEFGPSVQEYRARLAEWILSR